MWSLRLPDLSEALLDVDSLGAAPARTGADDRCRIKLKTRRELVRRVYRTDRGVSA